jgi:hypothetical protein
VKSHQSRSCQNRTCATRSPPPISARCGRCASRSSSPCTWRRRTRAISTSSATCCPSSSARCRASPFVLLVAQRGAARSQDPSGKTVPIARGGWEKEMPNARWGFRIRRTQGGAQRQLQAWPLHHRILLSTSLRDMDRFISTRSVPSQLIRRAASLCCRIGSVMLKPADLPVQRSIYARSRLPCVTLPSLVPAFEAYCGCRKMWPVGS